jgi:hypothetical protein
MNAKTDWDARAQDRLDNIIDAEPEPLRRPLPKAMSYPVESLGPILAGAVQALAKTVQAPDAVAANCILTAASLAVQGHADVQQDMIRAPLSLFMLTVAESGERKTGTDVAMRPFDDRRKLELQVYRKLQADHEREHKEHTVKRSAAERQCKDGEGLADALKELGEPPRPPRQPTRTMENVTLEGVFKSLQLGCQSQALISDEGAIVFGGHSMTQDHKLRLIATLSKLWDAKPIDRVRQDGGYVCLEGRRLCSHLMVQPVVAEKVLSDDDMVGQGLMARFLIAWPESKIGWRPYAARSAFSDPLMIRYCHRIAELIEHPHPVDHEDPDAPLTPRTITLSPEAAAEWIAFHDDLEVKQRPEGPLVEARAWASKMPQQALRLAGVLAMVEDHTVTQIPAETMRRALTLAGWYMHEAVRLTGASVTPRPIRDAETLLQWIHASGRQAVYSQLLQNKGPRAVGRDKSSLDRAIEVLVGAGWLMPLPEGTVLDDKPRKRAWRVWQKSTSRVAA